MAPIVDETPGSFRWLVSAYTQRSGDTPHTPRPHPSRGAAASGRLQPMGRRVRGHGSGGRELDRHRRRARSGTRSPTAFRAPACSSSTASRRPPSAASRTSTARRCSGAATRGAWIAARSSRPRPRSSRSRMPAAISACRTSASAPASARRTAASGTLDEAYRTYFERGSDRVSPFMIPLALTNTACAAVARTLQLRGPSSSTCTACAAGADAIGTALWLIRSGPRRRDARRRRRRGDLARRARRLPQPRRARDAPPRRRGREPPVRLRARRLRDRRGLGRARARGARARARARRAHLCGARRLRLELRRLAPDRPRSDGRRPRAPRCRRRSPTRASARRTSATSARMRPRRPRATSPRRARSRARASRTPPVSATKSLHGHTLGGAGGVEAAASLLPIVRGIIPPTLNLVEPDDGCGLDHVMGAARRDVDVRASLSNSFGFGGHNAALVLRQGLTATGRAWPPRARGTRTACERTIAPSEARAWQASVWPRRSRAPCRSARDGP